MTQTIPAEMARDPLTPLSWKQIGVVWFVLIVCLLPAMAFMLLTEREVSQYSTLRFESAARAALDAGQYARAERVCTGALRTGIERSDYWGLAFLLRAKARAAQGNSAGALADLRPAARLWTRFYYYPTDPQRQEAAAFGTELGQTLSAAGDADAARLAFSAAGVASGAPSDYLHDLCGTLDADIRRLLGPEEPYLVLETFDDFAAPRSAPWLDADAKALRAARLSSWSEEQGRTLVQADVDAHVDGATGPCATLEIGASAKDGRSQYGIPVYLRLTPQPFAIRVRVKEKQPADIAIALEYWFDKAHRAAATHDEQNRDCGGGWRQFDLRRNFYEERAAEARQKNYDPTDGIINRIGLSLKPGPANQLWMSPIELYIPQ